MDSVFKDKSFQAATIISIILLVVAIVFCYRLTTLIPLIRFPLDANFFCLECIYYAVMIHLLIFALATWLYTSNFHNTRFETRIFMATVLLAFWLIALFYCLSLSETFTDDTFMIFDKSVWDNINDLVTGPGFELILLLICALIMIGYVIWGKIRPPQTPVIRRPRVRPSQDARSSKDAKPSKVETKSNVGTVPDAKTK